MWEGREGIGDNEKDGQDMTRKLAECCGSYLQKCTKLFEKHFHLIMPKKVTYPVSEQHLVVNVLTVLIDCC